MDRSEVLQQAVAARRGRSAADADRGYRTFCDRYRVESSPAAVCLYLTWLRDQRDASGPELRGWLQRLDLQRRLNGDNPWSDSREVADFLAGLHAGLPRGRSGPRCDPLYLELVCDLVDAIIEPTLARRRRVAALAIGHHTGLAAMRLARLGWRDLAFFPDRVDITVVSRVGRAPPTTRVYACHSLNPVEGDPVAALRALRAATPPAQLLVFGERGPDWTYARLLRDLEPLRPGPGRRRSTVGRWRVALAAARSLDPEQLRDRALVVIGYGAALTAGEASRLTRADVTATPYGLRVAVAGRRATAFLPAARGRSDDPLAGWLAWESTLDEAGFTGADTPALPQVRFGRILTGPLSADGANLVIRRRCQAAGLRGHHTFTSLRVGLIRTALRAGASPHAVGQQAGLASLTSVERHDRRENLLRHSVAGQLGL